ncbi:hypothetical protein TorRG33x02_168600 [Trema orientale]|uniref:Uncharacterized protein n=1 Tax=Trema orientale TaxID=63057 RepID=A0A2P5EP67_TREOI|nr:hypothetical protein TorRG33x02_168600 [Trema orientale]
MELEYLSNFNERSNSIDHFEGSLEKIRRKKESQLVLLFPTFYKLARLYENETLNLSHTNPI